MTKRQALTIIEDLAHKALNGGLKMPGKPVRVSDLKTVLRNIREIAREAQTKGG